MKLGFLASHGGSSMRAILQAIGEGSLAALPAVAISNNPGSPAIAAARAAGVPALHVSATTAGSADAADRTIADAFASEGVDLVVLSGYLRKLGPAVLGAYPGRILNIHPALLPKFGGQGMFGRHVHEAVLAAGETVSGATVHLVDEQYDHGPILAQDTVPVLPGDTAETLQARVGGDRAGAPRPDIAAARRRPARTSACR